MKLHRNAEPHLPGTLVPKIKHNLWQGKFHSTATIHSDQPTHGIAPECEIQLPDVQDGQNEPHWHLTRKCSNQYFILRDKWICI